MANFGLKIRDSKNTIIYKYFSNKENFNKLDELYTRRINTKDINIEYELDMLENEILILTEKNTYDKNEEVLLNNIKDYYHTRIDNNYLTLYYIFSPIFNDKYAFKKIFSFFERAVINNHKRGLKKKIKDIANNYINNCKHLNTSKNILFEYLSSDYIDKEDEQLIDKILNKMINDELGLDYYETKFFLKIINKRQSIKYKYEKCKLYLDNSIPYIHKDSVSIDRYNRANHAFGIIIINSDYLNNKKYRINKEGLLLLIESTSHESFHYKQLYDFYHNNKTLDALSYLFEITVYDDRELYKIDYPFLPVEYLANKYSSLELKKISKYYFKENNDNKYDNFIRKIETVISYACSSSSNNNPPILDKYLIEQLSIKVKDNPILITFSSFLQLFFNNDGSLKTFNELLSSYKDNYFNMFYPFFTYTINDDIDTNDIKVVKILTLMANNEALAINKMLVGYEYFYDFYNQKLESSHTFNQNDIIKERLNRYNKYISLINNKNITNKLETIIDNNLLNEYIFKTKSYK